jgi:hypothetical protein
VELNLSASIEAYFEEGHGDFGKIQIIDLKRRGLEQLDGSGILREQIEKFVEPALWDPCLGCSSRGRCPIFKNKDDLASKYKEGVANLALVSHLRKKKRFTFRDARSAIAWAVTADLGCADVHAAIDRGDDLSSEDKYRVYSLLFDPQSQDALVQEWSELDPALMNTSSLNRHIEQRYPDLGPQSRTVSFRHREARKAFFGDSVFATNDRESKPYIFLAELLNLLAVGDPGGILKKKLLMGLSRISGPPLYDGEGLAVSSASLESGWSVLRILDQENFNLARLHHSNLSRYIEYVPDGIFLSYKDRFHLNLHLDAFELVMRAAEGQVFEGQKTSGLRAELTAFAQRIASQEASQVVLISPDQKSIVASNVQGSLTLSEGRS